MGRLTHEARYEAGYKKNNNVHVWECIDKLGKLEDLEQQGKLLKLPCAVGDRVYRINIDKELEYRNIDNIVILSDGTILLKEDPYDGIICYMENIITDKLYLDYWRCFLTMEEAEAALKNF